MLAFSRYVRGDWGELKEYPDFSNDLSLTNGGPVLGRYVSSDGVTFVMITAMHETVVLLPGDEKETERLIRKYGQPMASVFAHVLDYGMV